MPNTYDCVYFIQTDLTVLAYAVSDLLFYGCDLEGKYI